MFNFTKTLMGAMCLLLMGAAAVCTAEEKAKEGKAKQDTQGLGYMQDVMNPKVGETVPNRSKGGPTGSGIIYVRDKIPPVSYPPFKGERYDAMVPDTLDLAERAWLGINGITRCADPEADYETFAAVGSPKEGHVLAIHGYNGYNGGQAKWMQNLPLFRTMCGSTYNMDIDVKMMETMYRMLSPKDGLYYVPLVGAPWIGMEDHGGNYVPGKKQVFNAFPNGRVLFCMVTWWARNQGDKVMKKQIENMIDGYNAIAVDKGDECYLPERMWDEVHPKPEEVTNPHLNLGLRGMANYYRLTKYEPAYRFGKKWARHIEKGTITEKGDWFRSNSGHFHGTMCLIEGLLDWAVATDDKALLARLQKPFEQIRSECDLTIGIVPEGYPSNHPNTEPCGIGDMVVLSSKFSALGIADYYETVERVTRNLLAETQVTDSNYVQRWAGDPRKPLPPLASWERDGNITERMIGTWLGMSGVNGPVGPGCSHCCTGNAGRGIYYAWKSILTPGKDELRVNVLLNRASQWGDVDSYLPYQGRVDVLSKRAQRVLVRIPSWVNVPTSVTCTVAGVARPFTMKERYLDAGMVKPGQRVSVSFPLEHKTVQIHRTNTKGYPGLAEYDVTWTVKMRGFDAVDIQPKNERYQFFARDRYCQDEPKWKMVTRFVPKNEYWY